MPVEPLCSIGLVCNFRLANPKPTFSSYIGVTTNLVKTKKNRMLCKLNVHTVVTLYKKINNINTFPFSIDSNLQTLFLLNFIVVCGFLILSLTITLLRTRFWMSGTTFLIWGVVSIICRIVISLAANRIALKTISQLVGLNYYRKEE